MEDENRDHKMGEIGNVKFDPSEMVDGILSFIELEINKDQTGKLSTEEILKHAHGILNLIVVNIIDQFMKNGAYVFELIGKTDLKKLVSPVLQQHDQDQDNDH